MNPTLTYLYDLQLFGIKAGLRNISALLAALGHPERSFPIIHIAGTNGKGSTASMLASILTASGYRTGLYTSPHLVRFNERIRVNGAEIPDVEVRRYTELLRPEIDRRKATFFEATTAMAFQYFADRKVEVAVIETGLGGRWDATNVVMPRLSIITSIGLDHTEYLGKTLRSIAYEKGGIIKRGIPCLTGVDDPGIIAQLRRIARSRNAPFIAGDNSSSIRLLDLSPEGLHADIRTPTKLYRNCTIALGGSHQARNGRLAILAAEMLAGTMGQISEKTIRVGLREVRGYAGFRGRLEVLRRSPLWIADVAHNPDAVARVVREMKSIWGRKLLVLFGVMKDKDYPSMIEELKAITRLAIAVTPQTPRALAGSALVDELQRHNVKSIDGGTVRKGLLIARDEQRDGEPLLLLGSHFVVGEAIEALGNLR